MWGLSTSKETRYVSNDRSQDLEAVSDSPGAPGQVCHQDPSAGAHEAPGKGGEGGGLIPLPPDGLGQSRREPIDDGSGSLRGQVPGTETRPTRGEDHIHLPPVGPFQEEGDDGLRLIRDGGPEGHRMTFPVTPLFDACPTPVFPLSSTASVGNGEDADAENFLSVLHHRLMEPSV